MDKLSFNSPGKDSGETRDIRSDNDVSEMIKIAEKSDEINLYVVRGDDPYLDSVLDCNNVGEEELVVVLGNNDGEEELDIMLDSNDGPLRLFDMGDNEPGNDDDSGNSDDSEEDLTDFSNDDTPKPKSFWVNQEFLTREMFIKAVDDYAVDMKKNIGYSKLEREKVQAKCRKEGCLWKIYASHNSSSTRFVVRSFNDEHKCSFDGNIRLLSAKKIGKLILEDFRANPEMSRGDIKNFLGKKGITSTKSRCQRARKWCKTVIDAEHCEQFSRMWDYVTELRNSNPGSTVILGMSGDVFEKFYICFEALKDGWKSACRPILHLDGTFLRWRMKGELLTAIGRDANNQMFPVAWAIVNVENRLNWEWFLMQLIDDLNLRDGYGYTLMSDQQKGLVQAKKNVLPFAEHRMCARHIYQNWKNKHNNTLLQLTFWKAAKAYNKTVFEKYLQDMKMLSVSAYEDLMRYDASHWSRAYFTEFAKCEAVENNIGESFNSSITEARTKPVVEMLETIRRRVMTSNAVKIEEIQKYNGNITPKAKALLAEQIRLVSRCMCCHNGGRWYEVDQVKFRVNIRGEVSCTCRRYEICGIPCCHMICSFWNDTKGSGDPETLVSEWFSVNRWKRAYHNVLQPVNGMSLWSVNSNVKVLPPPDKRMPGRPKKNKRKRGPSEVPPVKQTKKGIVMMCSRCKKSGHNKRTCQANFVPAPQKRPRGRPRKDGTTSSGGASTQDTTQPSQPPLLYESQPAREGYGIFQSTVSGDNYVCLGRRLIDTRDNTVLPTTLFREHECSKMNVRCAKE